MGVEGWRGTQQHERHILSFVNGYIGGGEGGGGSEEERVNLVFFCLASVFFLFRCLKKSILMEWWGVRIRSVFSRRCA